MKIQFLGTCACTPQAMQDSTCFLIDDEILIDTGWNATQDMLNLGRDPLKLNYIFITHCHHDHFMGLPQLIFYQHFAQRNPDSPKLLVVGPTPEIKMMYERALLFLRTDHYGEIGAETALKSISPGSSFDTPNYTVETCPNIHPVIGMCYKVTEKASGKSAVFTGDTARLDNIAHFAEGADLLAHDSTTASRRCDPNGTSGHSGAPDAADIAALAHVTTLALVHYTPARRDEALAAAKPIFPNTIAPLVGEIIEL